MIMNNDFLKNNIIEVVGRKDTVGKPLLFGTTDEFLRQYEHTNLKDLPSLDNFKEVLEEEFENEIES